MSVGGSKASTNASGAGGVVFCLNLWRSDDRQEFAKIPTRKSERKKGEAGIGGERAEIGGADKLQSRCCLMQISI